MADTNVVLELGIKERGILYTILMRESTPWTVYRRVKAIRERMPLSEEEDAGVKWLDNKHLSWDQKTDFTKPFEFTAADVELVRGILQRVEKQPAERGGGVNADNEHLMLLFGAVKED